ncbi:MAG: hypothetical protein LBT56_05770, partial [Prevotellaceae bacterium]|nr:hypothetical protein [Prevotellaceae bacterium]
MKRLIHISVIMYCVCSSFLAYAKAINITTDLDSLDYYIAKQNEYVLQKENRISKIKETIALPENETNTLYTLYNNLFEEYRSYIYDSAYVCVEKLLELSYTLNDTCKITASNIKLGFCYLSSGLFKEAFDIFSQIDVSNCDNTTKIEYYLNKARLYYDLGDYNNSDDFRRQYDNLGNKTMDFAIELLPHGSAHYWAAMELKHMKSANYKDAINAFEHLISTNDYSEHELAIATSSLSYVYFLQGVQPKA